MKNLQIVLSSRPTYAGLSSPHLYISYARAQLTTGEFGWKIFNFAKTLPNEPKECSASVSRRHFSVISSKFPDR